MSEPEKEKKDGDDKVRSEGDVFRTDFSTTVSLDMSSREFHALIPKIDSFHLCSWESYVLQSMLPWSSLGTISFCG